MIPISRILATFDNHELFVNEVVMAHNIYRRRHSALPLKLDTELNQGCQERAIEILASNEIANTRYPERGENMCILYLHDEKFLPTGDTPVTLWYNQRYDMDFSLAPEQNSEGGNFCQVVWKASKHLGVGVARTSNQLALVCHYMPKGNVFGKGPANVSPELPPILLKPRPCY